MGIDMARGSMLVAPPCELLGDVKEAVADNGSDDADDVTTSMSSDH